MIIEDIPLTRLEPRMWNSLLDDSGSSSMSKNPFCRYEWLRLLSEGFPGWRVGVLVAAGDTVAQGGTLLAGLPYVAARSAFSRQCHALPWGTPAGVVQAPGTGKQTAERLIMAWAGKCKSSGLTMCSRLSITFPDNKPPPPGLETLKNLGFTTFPERSFSIRLKGTNFAEWEASLKDSVRNQNRQAERKGATFHRVSSGAEAAVIYNLAALTAKRHGRFPLLSERFYSLLIDAQGPLADTPGLVRVYMVRVHGKPSAFSVCLTHAGRLWLWDYGADRSSFEARPNNLMYRSIIEQSFEEGLDEVDLGAVPEGADSLEHFKLSFGGRPYERLSAVRTSSLFRLGAGLRSMFYRQRGGRA